jgi:hypothetical protein
MPTALRRWICSGDEVGAAGETTNVSHTFQPSGRKRLTMAIESTMHSRPPHRFRDRLGIAIVVLVTL